MKDPDSEGTADPTLADPAPADPIPADSAPANPAPKDADADKPEPPPPRPSAIERQLAATARSGRDAIFNDDPGSQAGAERIVGVGRFLAVMLLVAAGAILLFSEFGRPLRDYVSAALPTMEPAAAILQKTPAPVISQTVVPKKTPVAVTAGALTVAIADVSLRNRPELLEQLVQVYRSQLAINPTEPAALAALNQLQEQSFAELEAIVAEKDEQATAHALEIVSRSFPEQAYKLRYKFLREQRDQDQRDARAEPPVSSPPISELSVSGGPVSAAPVSKPVISAPSSSATPTPIPSTPIPSTSTEAISPSSASAPAASVVAAAPKKPAADVVPAKPQISVISVTPGAMVGQHFLPTNNGTAFMVEIRYRNFTNSRDQSPVTLTALLGVPGDSVVLAEAPVDIAGETGTKSFVMESLIAGETGERYRLNFILNGKLLASPTVRLQ